MMAAMGLDFLTPPFIIAILLALTIHEWAHAYAAWKLGDPTAKYEGRLTLNPIAHLDPMGTILFLLVGFGWGKPVPVDPRFFRHPKRDMAIVALAGPLSNLVLAFVGEIATLLVGIFAVDPTSGIMMFISEFLQIFMILNLSLMAFNLLPIAPLDGSKILLPFIPRRYEWDYERFMQYGPYVLLFLLVAERMINFPFLAFWITTIARWTLKGMQFLLSPIA